MQAKVRTPSGETEITSDVCAHSRVQLAKGGQEGLKFLGRSEQIHFLFFPEGQVNNIYQGWTPALLGHSLWRKNAAHHPTHPSSAARF